MYNILKYLIACFMVTASAYVVAGNSVPITKVVVIPAESSAFTLQLSIKNNNVLRTNWKLGFFMFHVLAKPNDKLRIKICQINTDSCINMKVITNESKMIGHINLIAPIHKFQLRPNKTYTITIIGLVNSPRNISAMPEQIFFYDSQKKVYSYITVSSYNSLGYNQTIMVKQLESDNLSNWNKYKSEPIKSYVIPTPVTVIYKNGVNVGNNFSLVYYCNKQSSKSICKKIMDKPEGYVLSIESNQVNIYANTEAGVFYAKETIKQLKFYYNNQIPVETIIDYPRFKYRGIMLDTVRHFFSVAEVKQLLDIMAENKLNTLHLHLADDEGWRIALSNYKSLTEIGSNRGGENKIPASNLIDDKYDITNIYHRKYEKINTAYHGYYSIKDIKLLIKYANERQITIIPEIEMPGHALAMKRALPSILTESTDVSRYFSVQGYTDNVLPICKYGVDQKFTTAINEIVQTIAGLFNNQKTVYAVGNEISLSGDEVPNGAYGGLSYCKMGKFARLNDEDISHQYFKFISESLVFNKLSGWQQLVQSDNGNVTESFAISPNQVGHIWLWLPTTNVPVSGYVMAANLLKAGYPVVLDFANYTYFDMRYASLFYEPGLYWSINYSGTYNAFNIGNAANKLYAESGLNKSNLENLLGVEGTMWSELVPTSEHLWYMMLPKMTGLAEAAWAQKTDLNWRSFAMQLGCGNSGFLYYLYRNYRVIYRGYPYGINREVPTFVCGNLYSESNIRTDSRENIK